MICAGVEPHRLSFQFDQCSLLLLYCCTATHFGALLPGNNYVLAERGVHLVGSAAYIQQDYPLAYLAV